MAAPDYNAIYEEMMATLTASGLDVSSLTKGDESVQYRSASDLISLLEWLKSQDASGTAAVRTVAKNVRPTG